MRETTDHRSSRDASAAASVAPVIRFEYSAENDRLAGFEALTDRFEPELVEAAERGQIRGQEGSVDERRPRGEYLDLDTLILPRGLRLSLAHESGGYTVNCEEPLIRDIYAVDALIDTEPVMGTLRVTYLGGAKRPS